MQKLSRVVKARVRWREQTATNLVISFSNFTPELMITFCVLGNHLNVTDQFQLSIQSGSLTLTGLTVLHVFLIRLCSPEIKSRRGLIKQPTNATSPILSAD